MVESPVISRIGGYFIMASDLPANPIRVAMLGTGNIALPHVAALKSLPGIKVVAVCDLDEAKARAFAQHWGVPSFYRDLAAMLESEKPDVVHVLLPPPAHASACHTCLTAGSHIFVEKPFCDSREASERIRDLAEHCGLRAGVNHNVNYIPGVLKALELARTSRLGGIEQVSVHFSLPNPGLTRGPHNHWMFSETNKLMLEVGPHPMSVLYRFLGKATSCSALASGEMLLGNGKRFFHTWQASLDCERGTGQFFLSVGKSYPSCWVHVMGQDGEAFVDLSRSTIRVFGRSPYRRTGPLRQDLSAAASVARQSISLFLGTNLAAFGLCRSVNSQEVSITNSITDFYAAMKSGAPTPAGAEEGTDVVEACEMIIEDAMARMGTGQGVHCG